MLHHDRPAIPRWALPTLLVLVAAVVGVGALQAGNASTTTTQLSSAADTANDLAGTIAQACSAGTIPVQYASACVKARQVVAQPVAGPEGAAGATGPAGRNGLDGATGAAGVAGPAGAAGAPGAPGAAGSPGATGATGPAGTNGVDGKDGAQGAPGPAGPAGAAGRDGVDGCDAGFHHAAGGGCVADAAP